MKKSNELRRIDSEVFEFTGMPVCFGNKLCGYKNRGWTYVTPFLKINCNHFQN